jgi:hypothetical protein
LTWRIRLVVLLLVFWYYYKRGRDVRLEKERQVTEEKVAKLEKEYEATSRSGILITTAPEGASIEHVEAGMREVEEVKRAQTEGYEGG